ncbi:MAG: hypothetical protein H6984_11065 [Pseudomonadales bacterium]|nr:hypothetical protein [Halioglobus sp.]MCP5122998.1 hypothetical protein [Pseudomonadales bacterium]
MIGTRNLAPVLAALLLVAATALAQTADDEGAAGAGKPPSAQADNSGATAGDAGGKPGNAERSPSDYRASEKISEDLPVSFPVDI